MALQRRSRADTAELARERGELAAVISARRQELGLSQVELGELSGVSYRIVHNLEAGRSEVSLQRVHTVLQTLGLHLTVERGVKEGVVAGASVAHHYGLPGPDAPARDVGDGSGRGEAQ